MIFERATQCHFTGERTLQERADFSLVPPVATQKSFKGTGREDQPSVFLASTEDPIFRKSAVKVVVGFKLGVRNRPSASAMAWMCALSLAVLKRWEKSMGK